MMKLTLNDQNVIADTEILVEFCGELFITYCRILYNNTVLSVLQFTVFHNN